MTPTIENLRWAAAIFRSDRRFDEFGDLSKLAADALDRWAAELPQGGGAGGYAKFQQWKVSK